MTDQTNSTPSSGDQPAMAWALDPTTTTTTPKKADRPTAKKKTSPTTTKKNSASEFASVAAEMKKFGSQLGIQGLVGAAGVGGTSNIPGVTSTEAGDTMLFAPAGGPQINLPDGLVSKLVTKDAQGNSVITYANAMLLVRELQGTHALTELQQNLAASGFISPTSKVAYGTLDAATLRGWTTLVRAAVGANLPLTTLLTAHKNTPQLIRAQYALQTSLQTAARNATEFRNVNVSLADPNEVAQRYASAMESLGLGAPTQQQTDAFVHAFIYGPQGERAAAVNQAQMQERNYMAGWGDLTQAQQSLDSGNLSQETKALNTPGPVGVATKTTPNLDAEAMAAAKAANPGAYYAQGASEMYGILQEMLNGGMQMPTSATPPSAQGIGGAVVTTPIAGVM